MRTAIAVLVLLLASAEASDPDGRRRLTGLKTCTTGNPVTCTTPPLPSKTCCDGVKSAGKCFDGNPKQCDNYCPTGANKKSCTCDSVNGANTCSCDGYTVTCSGTATCTVTGDGVDKVYVKNGNVYCTASCSGSPCTVKNPCNNGGNYAGLSGAIVCYSTCDCTKISYTKPQTHLCPGGTIPEKIPVKLVGCGHKVCDAVATTHPSTAKCGKYPVKYKYFCHNKHYDFTITYVVAEKLSWHFPSGCRKPTVTSNCPSAGTSLHPTSDGLKQLGCNVFKKWSVPYCGGTDTRTCSGHLTCPSDSTTP
ncbi:hypothetical protein D9Q98_004125 [Chlorella vulgaris]|uniref:Uncharacterized protein n=1 Tax=Chlorella vulgaris TaxID=3077 RepID=A0A9D4TR45_CHLVU|nr:hypothetical protein D9Q98_004125 [Chlorella vulgaris]